MASPNKTTAPDPAEEPDPTLAPPGAGIPKLELWIGRIQFRHMRRKMSRAELQALFESESARVSELARSCSPDQVARRVLIERIRGLEDSSRHWSVAMTLDHLRIVNAAIVDIIQALARDQQPAGVVRTADIKPEPAAGPEILGAFDDTCRDLARAFAEIPDLNTEKRHRHPWFGPLDAAGWHAMAAMHTRIHRKQIERILAGLEHLQ